VPFKGAINQKKALQKYVDSFGCAALEKLVNNIIGN